MVNNKYLAIFIVCFSSVVYSYIYSHVFAAHQLMRVTFASIGTA